MLNQPCQELICQHNRRSYSLFTDWRMSTRRPTKAECHPEATSFYHPLLGQDRTKNSSSAMLYFSRSYLRPISLAAMMLSSTLFHLSLTVVLVSGQLLPTEQTAIRWPRKAEPMIDRHRQQRSVGSSEGNRECLEDSPEGLGASYSGKVNVTASGTACQAWSATHPREHPFTGVGDHNYCRNPTANPRGVWCLTTDPNMPWDYCSVPLCSPTIDCQEGKLLGVTYVGSLSVTQSGRTCQSWSSLQPHEHPFTTMGDHNHCRNPVGDPNGVWCHTTDPDMPWEYCSVPICATMLKVLDFSADSDHNWDSNGEYTHASLKAGPLPEIFTICSAFMVEAWTTEFSGARVFEVLAKDGRPWVSISLFAASSQYEVALGPVRISQKIESLFFPFQWSRACLSVDSVAGKVRVVVDGQLLGGGGVQEGGGHLQAE